MKVNGPLYNSENHWSRGRRTKTKIIGPRAWAGGRETKSRQSARQDQDLKTALGVRQLGQKKRRATGGKSGDECIEKKEREKETRSQNPPSPKR